MRSTGRAGAGLVVGLMMAPKSGDETRGEIGKAVDEYLESAKERADGLKTSAANLAQRGIREVQRTKEMIADKVRDAVTKREQQANSAIDKTAAAVNSGAQAGHEAVQNAAHAARSATRA